MKYTRPEVEIMELDVLDVIQTSGEEIKDPILGDDDTPITPFSTNVPTI